MIRNIDGINEIKIDCSRIAALESGLGRYACRVVESMKMLGAKVSIISRKGLNFDGRVIPVPEWVATNSAVSIFRPLSWLLYSSRYFPVGRQEPLLSVMQNVVTRTRNQVVTIHDLRPIKFPDNPFQGFYWKYLLPRSLRRIRGIITVSETSKKNICQQFGIPESKIAVVHNAFDAAGLERADWSEARARLLCVGCNWKHKNIHEFLEWHDVWSGRYQLDIVMSRTKYCDFLKERVADLGIESAVNFHHGVSDEVLGSLYRNAAALIYPSVDEGFGIPPLEAMTYGIPVVASDIEVFRELFGEAPIYVSLGDRDSWTKAIACLSKSELVQVRIRTGTQIAESYSGLRFSEELASAIRKFWPQLFL